MGGREGEQGGLRLLRQVLWERKSQVGEEDGWMDGWQGG